MKNTLLENYLASQFKFGFELEGFKKDGLVKSYWDDFQPLPLYDDEGQEFPQENENEYSDTLNEEDAVKNISDDITQAFKLNKPAHLKHDGSLDPDSEDDYAFEWASPVMEFNPKTIKKCIDGLDWLMQNGYYTNETCGFHIHLSFPNISDADCVWIISKLSLDEDMLWTLSDGVNNCDFYSDEWADMEFLRDLADALRDGQYEGLSEVFTTEKYRMLHIHPQGTIEWRGPRNFMNDYRNNKPIYEFFKLLYKFVRWIGKALASNKILGMSKDNYFKIIFDEDYKENDLISDFNKKEKEKSALRRLSVFLNKNDSSFLINLLEKYYKNHEATIYNSIKLIFNVLDESITKGDMKYTKLVKDLLLKCINFKNDKIKDESFHLISSFSSNILREGFRFLSKEEMSHYFLLALNGNSYNLKNALSIPVLSNQENNDVIESFNYALQNCNPQELNIKGLQNIFYSLPMIVKSGKYIKTPSIIDSESLHSEINYAINDAKLDDDIVLIKGNKYNITPKNFNTKFNVIIQICLVAHENEVLASVINQILERIYIYWSTPQPYINTMKEEIYCKYLKNIVLTGNTSYEFDI